LGSEQYHAMNSSEACRSPRWDSFEGRLFSTADFAWSRSGRFKLCFGVDLRLRACLPRFINWGLHVPALEYVAISRTPCLLLLIFNGFGEHNGHSTDPTLGHLAVSSSYTANRDAHAPLTEIESAN